MPVHSISKLIRQVPKLKVGGSIPAFLAISMRQSVSSAESLLLCNNNIETFLEEEHEPRGSQEEVLVVAKRRWWLDRDSG
jgi:hypothetical protein